MDGTALVLVLAAAGFHAGWNVLLHGADDRIAVIAVAGVASLVLLFPGIVADPPWSVWPVIVLSGVAQAAYGLLLVGAYQRGQLSLTYPIARGTAPLLVTIGGWLVLTERPSLLSAMGALLLGAGLALLARAGRGDAIAGVVWAVLTGFAIASYSLLDARGARQVSPFGYLALTQGLAGLIWWAAMRFDRARFKAALREGAVVAVGSLAAYLLVLFAVRRAPAGEVATVRECSVLLALALSRERPGRRLWLGAVFVTGGIVLTAL